ncbi:MAG: WD40 repeat domain-containing protein [Phenylobacterium sp.]|nr:MAG: WD40 repeat domain-containing protein [Phenylobacterium sp.]
MRPIKPAHITIAATMAATVLGGCGDTGESQHARAARELRVPVPVLIHTQPRQATLYAAAAQTLDPTPAGSIQLLSVALGFPGVQRVLQADSPMIAGVRTTKTIISSDRAGQVMTWDPSSGAVLASVTPPRPVVLFAASGSPSLAASIDDQGALALWNLENPREPIEIPIAGSNGALRQLAAFAFGKHDSDLYALTRTGNLYTYDVPTHTLRSVRSLHQTTGNLPWGHNGAIPIAAAHISEEAGTGTTTLVVATARAGVASIKLPVLKGSTLMPASQVTETPIAVQEQTYGQPRVILATARGVVFWNTKTQRASTEATGPVSGLAWYQDELTAAGEQGIATGRSLSTDEAEIPLSQCGGRPARALLEGPGGPLALNSDGTLSVVTQEPSPLSIPTDVTEASTIAQFDPEGDLLETSGTNANHITSLIVVTPTAPAKTAAESDPHRVLHTYTPSGGWWPQITSNGPGLFLDTADTDSQYVVAGGQDPTGTAVVLVWDKQTGKPLRRLPLTTGVTTPPGTTADTPPSIVPQVELLPGRHLLAAYSALQELVVLWSTTTWQRTATIDVGPVAGFSVSPDESTILVTSPSDKQSGLSAGNTTTRLVFYDTQTGAAKRHVTSEGTELAGYTSAGNILTVKNGVVITQLNSDATAQIKPPVTIEAGHIKSIAWRPGSELAATVIEHGGVRLVNLENGETSPELTPPEGDQAVDVSFNPAGNLLAESNGTPTGSFLQQAQPSIWRVGNHDLEQRACELSGGAPSRSEWETWTHGLPYMTPCRSMPATTDRAPRQPPEAPGRPVMLYQHGESIEAATTDGTTRAVGTSEPNSYPPVQFAWSADASAGWLSQELLHSITPSPSRVHSAPCPCSGVTAATGGGFLALQSDGSALLRFTPALDHLQRTQISGVGPYQTMLLTMASGRAIVAGYPRPLDRNTPTSLYLIAPSGRVQTLAGALRGALSGAAALSPSGAMVAIPAVLSGGACYSPEHVTILNVRTGRASYPAMPAGIPVPVIRSLRWSSRGTLEATIAPTACGSDGASLTTEPEGKTYTLSSGRFTAIGRPAPFASETGREAEASITGPVPVAFPQHGTVTLKVTTSGRRYTFAGVSQFSVRP